MDQRAKLTQNLPQMPEDHGNVVDAAAAYGEKRIADDFFQCASCQPTVVFHIADHRLNHCPALPREFGSSPGNAAARTADEDFHILHAMDAASAIDNRELRLLVGQDFDLLQHLGQHVAVVGQTG